MVTMDHITGMYETRTGPESLTLNTRRRTESDFLSRSGKLNE